MMNDDMKKMSQEIRNRISDMAYLMWETAGRQQGMAMEYWLAAEKEVISTAQQAAEKMMPARKKAPANTPTPTPATKAAPKAADKSADKSADKPATKAASKTASEPAAKPAAKSTPRKTAGRGKTAS